MSKTKTIELTKKQFLVLLKAVYIGDWIANAQKIPSDKEGDEYEQIKNLMFSYAEKFGLHKFVDHRQADGDKYYPARLFEEDTDVHVKIEEYEEEFFWQELIDRLARLHILKDFGKPKLDNMTIEEYWKLLDEYIEKYFKEFQDHGLENLLIDNSDQD